MKGTMNPAGNQRGTTRKLPGKLARIAALLTLAADPHSTTIQADTMRAAIGLADWLRWHALDASRTRTPEPHQRVLRWLSQRARDSEDSENPSQGFRFSTRDVQQALKGSAWVQDGGPDAVRDALLTLCQHGWAQPLGLPNTRAGRPKEL